MKPSAVASIEIDILWTDSACGCGRSMRIGEQVFAVGEQGRALRMMMCGDCVRPHVEAKRELAKLPEPERSTEADRLRAAERDARFEAGLDRLLKAVAMPFPSLDELLARPWPPKAELDAAQMTLDADVAAARIALARARTR